MNQRTICKSLTVAVIILFLGLAIQPSVAVQPETEIDIEPKDYLFQTIIEIANNPEVKELFEQYKPKMFNVDIDRSIYRKILFRNPRMFCSMIFTNPSISQEYLNFEYLQGNKIAEIIGEDKVLDIIKSVKLTDTKILDEINNIIRNNGELTCRYEILEEMNKKMNPARIWPILCDILLILEFFSLIMLGIVYNFLYKPYRWIVDNIEMPLLPSFFTREQAT